MEKHLLFTPVRAKALLYRPGPQAQWALGPRYATPSPCWTYNLDSDTLRPNPGPIAEMRLRCLEYQKQAPPKRL